MSLSSKGLPTSSQLRCVSGRDGSRMVVNASTKRHRGQEPANRSGDMFATAPTDSPPRLRRGRRGSPAASRRVATRWTATAMSCERYSAFQQAFPVLIPMAYRVRRRPASAETATTIPRSSSDSRALETAGPRMTRRRRSRTAAWAQGGHAGAGDDRDRTREPSPATAQSRRSTY